MNIYFKAMKLHLKSLLEYKLSFILGIVSQIFSFLGYYFIILALFAKFGNVKGFTLYEILLTFSIVQFGFSINEVFARGIDQFDNLIIEGNFDRILLRPKSIIVQILTTEIAWIRISKTIQALIIMIIALVNLKITLTFAKILTLIMMLISSVVIFFGIFLLMAAYCFYTVKGLEVRNIFTDGGKHVAQYPIGIFKKGFVFIFTFIIPYACVNYYPLLYFLGKSNSKLYMFSPLLVIIYLIFPFLIFKKGLKRYASTGS